jgi:L-arabinokinase
VQVRTREQLAATGDDRWFAPAIALIEAPPNVGGRPFLEPHRPVTIARAPGRLDVMGGIADYSGSLVLEMPLACATYAIAQGQAERRLDVVSFRGDRAFEFSIELDDILRGDLSAPERLAAWFARRPDDRWAAYVVGAAYRCLTLSGVTQPLAGLRLLITSEVPEGKGVSSSAALEVAVMSATVANYRLPLDGVTLASACQWAENFIAGAPCGIMDQMTSALGHRDRLLRLTCQPATLGGYSEVPPGYRFYGIDSGIRHAVTGADYGSVRTAAFMGYRLIAEIAGFEAVVDGDRVKVRDDRWNGYLANISPRELTERFADALPDRMLGSEFVARYSGITDVVTKVEPSRWYPVRAATMHPVYENDRVTRFGALLDAGLEGGDDAAIQMGGLMLGSHGSYSMCGLGSDGTDRLVELALEYGPDRGVFGAKITGGGSGGTVAIFGTDSARQAILDIARRYEDETGRSAFVFEGSGPGAEELGVLSFLDSAPSALRSE